MSQIYGVTVGNGWDVGAGWKMGLQVGTTAAVQNISTNPYGAYGYFFRVYGPLHNNPPYANFDQIQPGWTCVQLPGSVVVAVVPDPADNNESCTIQISGRTFVLNQFYSFTGYP
jgi:hypothetical protein